MPKVDLTREELETLEEALSRYLDTAEPQDGDQELWEKLAKASREARHAPSNMPIGRPEISKEDLDNAEKHLGYYRNQHTHLPYLTREDSELARDYRDAVRAMDVALKLVEQERAR